MAKNDELSRVLGWIDKLNTSLDAARSDQTAMSNLLTSAEYELQQVRRQLSGVAGGAHAPELDQVSSAAGDVKPDAGAKFAQKLRHPDGLRHGWWTVYAGER